MSSYKRPKERIILKEADDNSVNSLAEKLSISKTLARILVSRGLSEFEDSKEFFNPDFSKFLDPFLFKDMQKSVERIEKAINNNESITIHGDYDVDGVTSTTLMMRVLSKLGANVNYYIPDRLNEGYGLSNIGIDEIFNRSSSLIITVDCAITAIKSIEYANSKNIDTIITDHHEAKEKLPNAYAIINHKVKNETYPEQILAGVGVALKLLQGLCIHLDKPSLIWEEELPFVALGTAADIVPIIGENRIIAHFGYKKMRDTKNIGLQCLMKAQNIEGKDIQTADAVFKLAPSINAAGRLGDPSRGVTLFLSENEIEASVLAEELVSLNHERRTYDEQVQEEVLAWAYQNIDFENEFSIVAGDNNWHAGVIGISASKMVEKFCRPSFLFSIDKNGEAHGSGRSIAGCNLIEALDKCKDLLKNYGGHSIAAGASLDAKNLKEFRVRFNNAIKEQLTKEQLTPIIKCDTDIRVAQLTPKFYKIIKRMEPFGPKNMRPTLLSSNLTCKGYPKRVGHNGAHLKLSVVSEGQIIDAIGFNLGDRAEEIVKAEKFALAYNLTENTFKGRTTLQMSIKGISTK